MLNKDVLHYSRAQLTVAFVLLNCWFWHYLAHFFYQIEHYAVICTSNSVKVEWLNPNRVGV